MGHCVISPNTDASVSVLIQLTAEAENYFAFEYFDPDNSSKWHSILKKA
jgi:hypothetical protein